MSKIITITDETLREIATDFIESIRGTKFPDGKITYSKNFGAIDRKATLQFTPTAWIKQDALVRECNKEVAWHGIAKRVGDENDDVYVIEDILVYPQVVTGATVETDQEEYQTWLMNQEDDVFNNIRMQGHSHVNMGTTPSSVDTSLYERILGQLEDDMFYIFLIWNKQNSKTIKIYDIKKNILFETNDIKVEILGGVSTFLEESKKLVKDRPAVTPLPTPTNQPTVQRQYPTGYSGYGGYGGYLQRQAQETEEKKKGKRKGNTGYSKEYGDLYYTGFGRYSGLDDDDY